MQLRLHLERSWELVYSEAEVIEWRGSGLRQRRTTRPHDLHRHVYVLMEHEQKRVVIALFSLIFGFWIWSIFVFMLYHDMTAIPYLLRDLFQIRLNILQYEIDRANTLRLDTRNEVKIF